MTMDPNPTRPTWSDPAPTTPVSSPTAPATSADAPSPSAVATPAAAVAPAAPVAASAPKKGRGLIDWLLIGAAVLAIGGVAFAVGRTTAPATTAGVGTFPGRVNALDPNASFAPGTGLGDGVGRPGAGGPGLMRGGSPTIDGTVTAIDGTSMTIELETGDTTTVALDGSTTYHEATTTDAGSVAIGDDVSVRVSMDGLVTGGDGAGGTPGITASDVTVTR